MTAYLQIHGASNAMSPVAEGAGLDESICDIDEAKEEPRNDGDCVQHGVIGLTEITRKVLLSNLVRALCTRLKSIGIYMT